MKTAYPRLILIRTGEEFKQLKSNKKSANTRAGFRYVRNGDGVDYYKVSKGAEAAAPVSGYRSVLRLEIDSEKAVEYHAIERANGFTHVPEGVYQDALMRPRAHHTDKQELYLYGAIFIHGAEYVDHLDGCIAPGKGTHAGGVDYSSQALAEIIEGLGGWALDKTVRIEIRGYKDKAGR